MRANRSVAQGCRQSRAATESPLDFEVGRGGLQRGDAAFGDSRLADVEVLELAPPYVQTELMGPDQKTDPRALPLSDFIAETMGILETRPDAAEILVERVKPQRLAESGGNYDELYKARNEMWKET